MSAKAAITFPNADNDVLIDFASSNRVPLETVLRTLSLPAKSTISNFDRTLEVCSTELLLYDLTFFCAIVSVKTVWDRDEVEFIKVGVKVHFALVQVIIGLLLHHCHNHLELVGHELHT